MLAALGSNLAPIAGPYGVYELRSIRCPDSISGCSEHCQTRAIGRRRRNNSLRLFEHPDFEQAILQAAEHLRERKLRPAIHRKAQCRMLWYGDYPSWADAQARFLE